MNYAKKKLKGWKGDHAAHATAARKAWKTIRAKQHKRK